MTPRAWVNKIPVKLDEKTAASSDPLMAAYQKSKGSIKKEQPMPKIIDAGEQPKPKDTDAGENGPLNE